MIKPIETQYKGYRFRSRLEARWAVFFDALGIEWEYEPQGFVVGNTPYLPDFYIKGPRWPAWVEIKPTTEIELADLGKITLLAENIKVPVLLLCGAPGENEPLGFCMQNSEVRTADFRITWNGSGWGFIEGGWKKSPDNEWYTAAKRAVDTAIAASRSARFEHGESPEVRSVV
jgi:hypothetical protein